MSRHRNLEATDIRPYTQLIPQSDDPLRAFIRWDTKEDLLVGSVVGPALPGFLFSQTFLDHHGTVETYSSATYALAIAGITAAGGLTAFLRAKRQYDRSLETAARFEAAIGESVDVVLQAAKRNKPRSLALRWYGLDGQDRLTGSMIRAAEAMASKTEEMGIETIAIGASWLDRKDDQVSLEKYGRRIDGASALTTLSGTTKKLKLNDTQADKEVLVTTPKQLRELMAEYRINDIRRIAELLPDDKRLQELLDTAEVTQDYAAVRGHVRFCLERELSDGTSLYAERDQYGIVHRSKASSQVRVRGTHVSSLTYRHNGESERVLPGERSTLLRECQVNDPEELLENVVTADKKRILAALHLALQDDLKQSDSRLMNASGLDNSSFFSRLKRSKERLSVNQHRVLNVTMGIFAIVSAGLGMNQLGDYARDNLYTAPTEHMKNLHMAFEAYEKQTGLQVERGGQDREAFIAYLREHYGERTVLEKQMSDLYLDVKDVDVHYIRWLTEHVLKWPLPAAEYQTPPSMYTSSENEAFIGDVKSGDATVYTAKALTKDATVGGYWLGSVFSEVKMKRGVSLYPFKDGQVSFSQASVMGGIATEGGGRFFWPDTLPYTAVDIARLTPDLQVETPYIADGQTIVLPLKAGTKLVGVQLIDAANPNWTPKAVKVTKSVIYDTISASFSKEDFIDNGVQAIEPKLVYFLKNMAKDEKPFLNDMKSELILTARRPDNYVKFSYADVHEVALATRHALGLSETASPEEIFKAISDKKLYSKTPFEDAKFAGGDVSNLTNVQAIESIATTIAELNSLNCNMATLLGTLATADQRTDYLPAVGFFDNGDGKLTQAESHAFFWNSEKGTLDATPGRIDSATESAMPTKDTVPMLPLTGGTLVVAAIMMVAYRKREELLHMSDKLRVGTVVRMPGMANALKTVEEAAYADPNDTSLRLQPSETIPREEFRRRYLANIPRGGISLSEIKAYTERQGRKISWPEQLALRSLRWNDAALRRIEHRRKTHK